MILTFFLLQAGTISGEVRSSSGPIVGAQVVARSVSSRMATGTTTDAKGQYTLPLPPGVDVRVELGGQEWTAPAQDSVRASARIDFTASAVRAASQLHPSSSWLGLLPDGDAKRKFILDCTGCHQFNESRALQNGAPRSAAQWATDVSRMLGYAGASSNFPVIAADRNPEATGLFVYAAVQKNLGSLSAGPPVRAPADRAVITEYDLPVAQDLPHDVAIDSTGQIVITGMFSHRMFVLDPTTGNVTETPIPVQNANPRAVELDAKGNWWVLLGGPRQVARYDLATRQWKTFPIGMYPHSVAVAPDGNSVWFNGHFTRKPIQMGRLDARTGEVQRFDAPDHPVLSDAGGPVPYEQRLAPDGTVWMSELIGNRILSLDPRSGKFSTWSLPRTNSGPRRFDIDRSGVLWIPAYSGNALVRFDPRSGQFTEFALPVSDAVPYVARVHPRTGDIWIGTAAADAVFRFEPGTRKFSRYPVLTRGATMRHMAIDPRSGDVWIAYGASPAIHPSRIARLSLR
ncbi:MAG TPA: carboxypeptidase regulatory-like domain-containing protein [Gemmatimonadales bacterium]|nr:carboxypeptidase regulatory-like domain-containing protein [Gemmatimonadales bacterium]